MSDRKLTKASEGIGIIAAIVTIIAFYKSCYQPEKQNIQPINTTPTNYKTIDTQNNKKINNKTIPVKITKPSPPEDEVKEKNKKVEDEPQIVVNTDYARSYSGTITNTTHNISDGCDFLFSYSEETGYLISGRIYEINLKGKFYIFGNKISSNRYVFSGTLNDNYSKYPMVLEVELVDNILQGKYTVRVNNKIENGIFKLSENLN